jgi:feruloyl esterase
MPIPSFRVPAAVALALVLSTSASFAQASRGQTACDTLRQLQVPGADLSEVKTEWVAAGTPLPPPFPSAPPSRAKLPAFCRLAATLDRRTGANGKVFGIGFALALPAEWNGRLLFQGGGGLNGSVAPPLGRVGENDAALIRGFAVVSTDTGHKGQVFDASFMADQQASLDFAYQAVGRVAMLAKQIVTQYYGGPAAHAYFMGCSTGGREGMLMTQRYPRYFDGVIVGAPAMRTNFSGIGDEWVATMLNRAAPAGADGKPDGRRALSDGDRRAVIDGVLASCDGRDGLRDGIVSDPLGCRFDPGELACQGPKKDGCLSAAQVDAISRAFAGPKDSGGRQVYPGFLFDTGIANTAGLPGLLAGSTNPVGPPFTATDMDVDRRAAAASADPQMQLTATSSWTNLNTFSAHGGKLIFYHGVSDPWFSALDTVDYYERMTNANGGAAVVMDWSRLFLVPGMGHCGGGPAALDGFDMLSAIVDWVESRRAPDRIRATGRAWPGRSRLLCPYPSHAQYKGTGDPEDSGSFECRTD